MKFKHLYVIFYLYIHVISVWCTFGHMIVSRAHFFTVSDFSRKPNFRNYKIPTFIWHSILRIISDEDRADFERKGDYKTYRCNIVQGRRFVHQSTTCISIVLFPVRIRIILKSPHFVLFVYLYLLHNMFLVLPCLFLNLNKDKENFTTATFGCYLYMIMFR